MKSGVVPHPYDVPLATAQGSLIPNERRKQHSPERQRAAREIWTDAFPEITVRSLSAVYNCVGLVFASRRTAVDADYVETLLREDRYRVVRERSNVCRGDLVVYQRNPEHVEHVGIIIRIIPIISEATLEFEVLSQWGSDGEFIHAEEDVPEIYGELTSYWTERRIV